MAESFATPTMPIDASGSTRSIQVDQTFAVGAAIAGPTVKLEGKCSRVALELQNLDAAIALTAVKIQARAHPNGSKIDYISSAQLNTGTAITNLLDLVVTNPTTLAALGKSLIIFNCVGIEDFNLVVTSASGTPNVRMLATAGSVGR